MNISFEALSAELRAPEGWTFADRPYGVEPLILPPAAVPDEEVERLRLHAAADSHLKALCPTLLGHGDYPLSLVTQSASGGQHPRISWFRWVTGHQISFVIWRLLLQEMRTAALADGPRQANAIATMSQYVRGYCAMLLYTASCSRDVYETLIRPSMFLAHPGFSGTWAPDFAAVRQVFRGRQLTWPGSGSGTAELRRAVDLNRLVHAGVAAKLVPNGGSLLQEAPASDAQRPEQLGTLFDSYFMTARAPGCEGRAVPQLLRRLEAVTLDLITHGLTDQGDEEQRPAELRDEAVLEVERDLIGTMLRVAEHAAGLDASDLGLQPQFV
ncbi:hypothetical protein ACQF36_41745 [Streptomyces sp. Marseille-Q5077]|uniref:hypothetical protein n=1 Tax=Streptomyces sp. Marseille-Q5077 TaxID=3418995 RepID=UPI003D049D27